MNTKIFSIIRSAGLLTGAWLLGAGGSTRAADKANADAFPNFESYIKISGQAGIVSGNDAAFQNRTKQPSDGGVGIEDLHLAKDLSKTSTLVVDGKALSGSEDYLLHLNLTKNEVGSVDAGFKRFRTFYDGAGGFFPLNNQWASVANEDLHIDRSKFWVEGKVALKEMPEFTVRYTNELRSGKKDSTIWGTSDFTGLPFNAAPNPINPGRKFAPSYIRVGERHELLEATVKHTVKNTTAQLTVFADRTNNSDTRFVTNYPGEVIPWSIASLPSSAQAAAKAATTPNNWNNQVDIIENDAMKTRSTGANFETDTKLSDQLTLRLGAKYDLVHTEIGGSRPLVTQTPTAAGVVAVVSNNYANLYGGTRVKDFAGNIGLDYKPSKNLFVKAAFRAQSEYISGSSGYDVVTTTTTPRTGWAKIHQNVRTPVLEVRYTGIKDIALYFTGSKRDLSGVERNTSSYNPLTASNGTLAMNNVSEDHGNYTLGANWKVSPALTLRGEVFRKGHKDNTVGFGTAPASIVGDYYLLDSTYDGVKLTAIAKPWATLGFTTRFIDQRGEMQVTGYLPTFPAYDSLDAKNYMISETIDWTPSAQVYFQLNGTVTYNVISTIYPRAGYTPATSTNNAFDSNGVVQNSNNDYGTLGFISGFVVDKNTDAQVMVNYYRASNGNAVLAPLSMPYGVVVEETSITVGLKHKFSDKWVGNGKLGYFDSTNGTSGNHQNYHGPVAYVSLEHEL